MFRKGMGSLIRETKRNNLKVNLENLEVEIIQGIRKIIIKLENLCEKIIQGNLRGESTLEIKKNYLYNLI